MYELVENIVDQSHHNWPVGVDESGFYIYQKGTNAAELLPFKGVRRIRTRNETLADKAKESALLAVVGLLLIGINVALIYGMERFYPILLLLGVGALLGAFVTPFLRRSVKLEVETDSQTYKGTILPDVWKRRGQAITDLLNSAGCPHETDLEIR